jgi:uncharacterized protein
MSKMAKKVIVIGASENHRRFSNMAVKSLLTYGYEVIAIGKKMGQIGTTVIHEEKINASDVFAITLYLNSLRQVEYHDYILRLKPKRLIFNPGTENQILADLAVESGIEVVHDCTLMMLGNGTFE